MNKEKWIYLQAKVLHLTTYLNHLEKYFRDMENVLSEAQYNAGILLTDIEKELHK